MNQQELFPVTVDEPRQVETSPGPNCKRQYLSGGEYKVCGHLRNQHYKVGDCFEVLAEDGTVLRRLGVTKRCCAECGCPEFQAREFRNPFLEKTDARKRVTSMTMCGNCRHAKKDHRRGSCDGMHPWDPEDTTCTCKKFVNPFIKTEEPQPIGTVCGSTGESAAMTNLTTQSVPLLSLDDVARELKVSKAWVRDHCTRRSPRIPCVRFGGRRAVLRFRRQDLDQFISQHLISTGNTARREL